jgi:predicted small lipoprotein YifL
VSASLPPRRSGFSRDPALRRGFRSRLKPLLRGNLPLLAAAWLAGCGMYGPLYLPKTEPAPLEERPPIAADEAPAEPTEEEAEDEGLPDGAS